MKSDFVPLWGLLCALLAGVVSAVDRPNVLLILVDDLKPTIGAYGDAIVHSPHLDRLAANGVRFDLAYCNQAVCAPSRNNLFVGLRSTTLGVYNLGMNFRQAVPEAVTLPQYFMQHGYRAESMGKVFHIGHGNTNDAASWSVPHYKELVIEYRDPASTPGGKLTREEAYFSNARTGRPNKELPRGAAWESPDIPDEAYADGRVATEAIVRLREAKMRSDQPFFMAVGFARPHLPFSVPKKYWDLYDRDVFPLAEYRMPPADAPSFAHKTIGELNQYFPIPERPPLPIELERTLIHGYYASVSYMDAQLGRVLDELERLGLDNETIVVLWGDHGWHLGDHGSWTKHTNYEQANRIPLIFSGPGVKPGGVTRSLASTVDIYPTLCELAGLPAPEVPQGIDGLSQVPALQSPGAVVKDHVYHAYPKGPRDQRLLGRAIRTEHYRMVEWKPIGAPLSEAVYELYDYETDPLETQNLAALQPEILEQLKAILATHPEAKPQATRQ